MSKRWKRANSISGFGQLREETVLRDLERRLRAIEVAGSGGIEIWIHQGGGTVRGPKGEQMTREEVEALGRATGTVTVFFTEIDIQL